MPSTSRWFWHFSCRVGGARCIWPLSCGTCWPWSFFCRCAWNQNRRYSLSRPFFCFRSCLYFDSVRFFPPSRVKARFGVVFILSKSSLQHEEASQSWPFCATDACEATEKRRKITTTTPLFWRQTSTAQSNAVDQPCARSPRSPSTCAYTVTRGYLKQPEQKSSSDQGLSFHRTPGLALSA